MQIKNKTLIIVMLMGAFFGRAPGLMAQCCVEPNVVDYTSVPIFQTASFIPNILIMLDNSGSMNLSAYPKNYGGGVNITVERGVIQASDDGEESASGTVVLSHSGTDDVDVGATDAQWAAFRFQNVNVPRGRTIVSARIEFYPRVDDATNKRPTSSMQIYGEAVPDSTTLDSATAGDVSSRARTTATTAWTVPSTFRWLAANNYDTPNLASIVEELTDNSSGWVVGNSMTFLFQCSTSPAPDYAKNRYIPRQIQCYDADIPGSTRVPRLVITYAPETTDIPRFYGYFNPDSRYTYSGSEFYENAGGNWSGNWLNWATMRRVDVVRKVMMGGLANPRTGTVIKLNGEKTTYPMFTSGSDCRQFIDDGSLMDPKYAGVSQNVCVSGGDFMVGADNYAIIIRKAKVDYPDDFVDDEIAGVLQKVGDKARWGNIYFNASDGARVASPVGTAIQTLAIDIQNTAADTYTPLGEAYFVAMNYFARRVPASPLNMCGFNTATLNQDPYYDAGENQYIDCAKSFVILLTDGSPTNDLNVPATYGGTSILNYDGDTHEADRTYTNNGSDYLDDIALYAHTNDLRPNADGLHPLDGDQSITLYTVHAFGDPDNPDDVKAERLLRDAAINGGFIDMNNNDLPDLTQEYDENLDGDPDTFFQAQDGYRLEKELMNAISAILNRAASGTAVSVLATKGEGAGTLVQAYFEPKMVSGINEIKWAGHLQAFWIDRYGNTREDTNPNDSLDLNEDRIIKFGVDVDSGDTVAYAYEVDGDPYPNTDYIPTSDGQILAMNEIVPIWEAGDLLATRPADERKIFTYAGGSFVEFDTTNDTDIMPYLGVEDNATWGYLGENPSIRTNNLIGFVRGWDDTAMEYQGTTTMRQRTLSDGRLWKLGDIVHSTPVTISKPVENYGLVYDDNTYKDFFLQYRDRETVVYVGSNGGMLHAFSAGVYDADNRTFYQISDVPGGYPFTDVLGVGNVENGSELWSYVPQNLLAHLKWLPMSDYPHVPYVDLRPRVVDARIFSDDATHPNGWGTIVIGTMRYGAKDICTCPDGVNQVWQQPSYFAIDVTNPRDPQFLWEQTYSGLGFGTNMPAIVKVDDSWMLAIGSGPTDFDGTSNQNASIFIVDLATGSLLKKFTTADANSYMNQMVAFDKGMNYNVDALFGSANYQATDWEGSVYRVTVPQEGKTDFDPAFEDYDEDPATWSLTKIFDSPASFGAPFALSIDKKDNCWIYGGSGRYIAESDKTSTGQQYIFGLKDPFFNPDNNTTCYGKYPLPDSCLLGIGDLFDGDKYTIKADQTVVNSGGVSGVDSWPKLINEARQDHYSGWFRTLRINGSGPSERVLSKPALLTGVVLVPTFTPNQDLCGYGGWGRLFALYYETGTAYRKKVFDVAGQEDEILDVIDTGEGLLSTFSVHVGRQKGGTIFGQSSTGVILEVPILPPFSPRSAPIYWKEEP